MKKRIIGLLSSFALALTFSMVSPVGAISLNAIDYNAIQPRAVLYDNDRVSGNASFDSTDFTASKGSGKTIRVWYDNKERSSVTVTLYKYGWFGTKEDVLVFDVSGNSGHYEEYTASGADSGKYYINIESALGDDITGYLRANQVS